jgi:hypothetical protein
MPVTAVEHTLARMPSCRLFLANSAYRFFRHWQMQRMEHRRSVDGLLT